MRNLFQAVHGGDYAEFNGATLVCKATAVVTC